MKTPTQTTLSSDDFSSCCLTQAYIQWRATSLPKLQSYTATIKYWHFPNWSTVRLWLKSWKQYYIWCWCQKTDFFDKLLKFRRSRRSSEVNIAKHSGKETKAEQSSENQQNLYWSSLLTVHRRLWSVKWSWSFFSVRIFSSKQDWSPRCFV